MKSLRCFLWMVSIFIVTSWTPWRLESLLRLAISTVKCLLLMWSIIDIFTFSYRILRKLMQEEEVRNIFWTSITIEVLKLTNLKLIYSAPWTFNPELLFKCLQTLRNEVIYIFLEFHTFVFWVFYSLVILIFHRLCHVILNETFYIFRIFAIFFFRNLSGSNNNIGLLCRDQFMLHHLIMV